jgi:hypothetical protein
MVPNWVRNSVTKQKLSVRHQPKVKIIGNHLKCSELIGIDRRRSGKVREGQVTSVWRDHVIIC